MVGHRMTGHADEILSLAVSGDGRLAATTCLDGSVWLWNLDEQQPIHKWDNAHQRGARAVAFSREQVGH
jgi:WD40 repeat protein